METTTPLPVRVARVYASEGMTDYYIISPGRIILVTAPEDL